MSVLIKNMEMPKSCDACMFSRRDITNTDWCVLTEKNLPCDCPLIEVPEQKHGKWLGVTTLDNEFICWVCSECRHGADFVYEPYNYCPNCGAQMDGDSDV